MPKKTREDLDSKVTQTDLNNGLAGKEPAKGADDNFVTDTEKVVIGNTSGANTGDQTLVGLGGIAHSLATAVNDFLVASGAGVFVKKTLAEVKTILDWAADIATHAALATGIHGVGASTVESTTGSQAKVDAHAGAADPHTGYQKESEKGAASGYAPLDAASKVPTVNLGGAGASGSNYLRGDQTWATPAGGGITTLKTTADQTINAGAATFVDITGLTFPVVAGVDYAFHFYITFRSAQTTTGWKSGVNHPGGTLDFWAKSDVIANGAAGVATHTERHNVNVNDMTQLTATVTANVDLSIIIEGRYKCTVSGTFAARFANELAANTNLVVQKGSWGWYF